MYTCVPECTDVTSWRPEKGVRSPETGDLCGKPTLAAGNGTQDLAYAHQTLCDAPPVTHLSLKLSVAHVYNRTLGILQTE